MVMRNAIGGKCGCDSCRGVMTAPKVRPNKVGKVKKGKNGEPSDSQGSKRGTKRGRGRGGR